MSVNFWNPDDGKDAAELNVSNANAVSILRALGIECDPEYPSGEFPAFEIVERCDQTLRLLDAAPTLDAELPWQEQKEPGHCTMIDCGRRDGYLRDRLTVLRGIAEAAGGGLVVCG